MVTLRGPATLRGHTRCSVASQEKQMPPQWNSSGVLGGPERRHGDRRGHDRGTTDRRSGAGRRRMRTAVLAAAMSSAPMARPIVALLPPQTKVKPSIDVSAEFVAIPAHQAYDDIIQEAAAEYDMDPNLIRAVMQAESAFHPYAVSRAGAEGLMQLMPELANEMGVGRSEERRVGKECRC